MNYKINWEKLTEKEAQTIVNLLASGFNLVAKSAQDSKFHDVSYLEVRGVYDDNFHTKNGDILLLEGPKEDKVYAEW